MTQICYLLLVDGCELSGCRQGASVEEMTIEVYKKKAALDNARRDVKQMLSLIKVCPVRPHTALPLIRLGSH